MCPDFRGKILGKSLPYIQIMRNMQILGIFQETENIGSVMEVHY
jgi:hypothetical protein